jgi:hypothetical protein
MVKLCPYHTSGHFRPFVMFDLLSSLTFCHIGPFVIQPSVILDLLSFDHMSFNLLYVYLLSSPLLTIILPGPCCSPITHPSWPLLLPYPPTLSLLLISNPTWSMLLIYITYYLAPVASLSYFLAPTAPQSYFFVPPAHLHFILLDILAAHLSSYLANASSLSSYLIHTAPLSSYVLSPCCSPINLSSSRNHVCMRIG